MPDCEDRHRPGPSPSTSAAGLGPQDQGFICLPWRQGQLLTCHLLEVEFQSLWQEGVNQDFHRPGKPAGVPAGRRGLI